MGKILDALGKAGGKVAEAIVAPPKRPATWEPRDDESGDDAGA